MLRGPALPAVLAVLAATCGALSAACLSIPAEKRTDGGPIDAGGDDAATDAALSPCGPRATYPGSAFPPADRDIALSAVRAADLNDDGFVDLVLANDSESEPDDDGFFVLLGPQDDPAALTFHAFVATGVSPFGLEIADVLAPARCQEVLVLGPSGADAGDLKIYRSPGDGALFDPTPLFRQIDFRPQGPGSPVLIRTGDFDGDGNALDIALADLSQLRLYFVGDDLEARLPTTAARPITAPREAPDDEWVNINGVFAEPAVDAASGDDLVVVEEYGVTWLRNDGAGSFGQAVSSPDGGGFQSRAVFRADLDGAPPTDFLGVGGVGFGAFAVSGTDASLAITAHPWPETFNHVGNQLNDAVAADLGDTAAPEIVALEVDEDSANASSALMVGRIALQGQTLTSEAQSIAVDFAPPFQANLGVAAAFDGASTEVWVFDRRGSARCIRRAPGSAQLEACPR